MRRIKRVSLIVKKRSPGGGIGRRVGLKIRLELNPVPVQVWPRAIIKSSKEFFFNANYFILLFY